MAEVTPGTTSKVTPAAASAAASSPPAGEHEGVAALEAHHLEPGPAPRHQQLADLVLVHRGPAGRLAHVDQLGAGRGQVEQAGHRQPVVHDHVGAAQHLGAPNGQQAGIPWPRAHQVDGHPASVGPLTGGPIPAGGKMER